jgi:putative ABC transport system permease protein
MNEIRHALRRLRATPIVTLSAIACLSIGVWMTCVISAIGAGFFRPDLHVPRADQLVQIDEVGLFTQKDYHHRIRQGRTISQAVLDSLAKRKLFAAIGFYAERGITFVGERGDRSATILSSGMMDVLGVRPALGRRFVPADDSVPGLIISNAVWRTTFGGDSSIVGRTVQVLDFTKRATLLAPIVGVMEEGFDFPREVGRTDVYLSGAFPEYASGPIHTPLARLRDGQRLEDVRAVVRDVAMRSVVSDREAMTRVWRAEAGPHQQPDEILMVPVDVRVDRYYHEPRYSGYVRMILLVLGCGLAVVMIATANVVNLLLVRGAARRQEIAVRMALGAVRRKIVGGLVIEAALVATAGALVGFAVAFWQWKQIDPGFQYRYWLGDIEWNQLPVAITAGLALTLIVGVWPGLRATAMNLEQVLRDTRRSGMGTSPLDSLLGRIVTGATAATVMLLVCASLLGLSARELANSYQRILPKGFQSRLFLDESRSRTQRADLAEQALGRVRRVGGMMRAALGELPANADVKSLQGRVGNGVAKPLPTTQVLDVSDGYFDALNIQLVNGRGFTIAETRDSTNAVVVSRSLATTLFGTGASVGRSFRYWDEADSVQLDATVVGIAETLPGVSKLQIYRSYGQQAPAITPLIMTTEGATADPGAISRALRDVGGVASSDVESLDAARKGFGYRDYLLIIFVQFAIVGMILAGIGTYGVVSYSVVRRTHEIGVRLALGADRGQVIRMILEQGLKITVAGAAFGLVLGYVATNLLRGYVESVKLNYPVTMAGVVALVMLVSLIACFVPGARAGGLNPVEALRAD